MTVLVERSAPDTRAAARPPLRILFVSYWFPPTNAIGAVRAGKLAKYLLQAGHDVRVIAGPCRAPLGLGLEVPEAVVSRAEVASRTMFDAARAHLRWHSDAVGPKASRASEALHRHWYAARHVPDKQRDWLRPATDLGRTLIRSWRPDLIVGSAPPYSALMAAARLGGESGIPWVAELRDPWSGNVYNDRPAWRDRLDLAMERRTLRSAESLVAVSPVVARDLQARYSQPVITVMNGFAPEDLPAARARGRREALTIVYTGTIYEGHRDPSALFEAIAHLPDQARRRIRVVFYGPTQRQVCALAVGHGVLDQVEVMPAVSYAESLQRQADADLLLLLQRDHPSDEGNLPAKFFEYIGALRPILLLGYEKGVLADMIRERRAGLVSNDPVFIATQLDTWIAQLDVGGVRPLPPTARAGLSRADQFAEYEAFLRARVVSGADRGIPPPRPSTQSSRHAQTPRQILDELPRHAP